MILPVNSQIRKFKTSFALGIFSTFSGFLITLQSRINGELSDQMGDYLEAALVSFGTGLIFVSLISLFRKDVRSGFADVFKAVASKQLPMWRLSAGMLGASFVAIQTHVVPIAGVALFTVVSLAGQTAISLWVDHVGLGGGVKSIISKRRVFAAIITVGAVVVSVWDRFAMSNFSILAITLAFFAGSWVGVQRALNGQINSFSKKSFATSQLNFITGFSFLTLLLILRSLFTDHSIMNLTSGPWWMFLGGSIGVFYIAISAVAVQYVGVLEFTFLSVGGMLIGSLLLDVFVPTQGTHISPYLIAGILLTYLGVIANGQSRFSRK
jgi:bacterial/archaeal transporter family-2 protein